MIGKQKSQKFSSIVEYNALQIYTICAGRFPLIQQSDNKEQKYKMF
jgi:hypothetical protein